MYDIYVKYDFLIKWTIILVSIVVFKWIVWFGVLAILWYDICFQKNNMYCDFKINYKKYKFTKPYLTILYLYEIWLLYNIFCMDYGFELNELHDLCIKWDLIKYELLWVYWMCYFIPLKSIVIWMKYGRTSVLNYYSS